MVIRAIYNRRGWVLCSCNACGRLNYVEPHGTTAVCMCNHKYETVHTNIPYKYRDISGTQYYGPRRLPVQGGTRVE